MKNQVQEGHALYVTAPSGGLTSGNGYLIGNLFGVAAFSATAGASGVLWRVGVYALTKLSAQAWNIWDIIYWDPNNSWCTNVAVTGGVRIGVAAAATANPTGTGNVLLDGLTRGGGPTRNYHTFLMSVQLADFGTGAETLNIDPGFNGQIISANFRVGAKAGAGSGATQSLQAHVNGTAVTGGVINPTLADTATPGAQVAGTAITAGNTFTASQPIGFILAAGGTVFTGGDGYLELTVLNTDA
jgi:predicted RecA/RadA family phage recombinase